MALALDPEFRNFQIVILHRTKPPHPHEQARPGRNATGQHNVLLDIQSAESEWWNVPGTLEKQQLLSLVRAQRGTLANIDNIVMLGLGSIVRRYRPINAAGDISQLDLMRMFRSEAQIVVCLQLAREIRMVQSTRTMRLYAYDPAFTADDVELLEHWGFTASATACLGENITQSTLLFAPWSLPHATAVRDQLSTGDLRPPLILHTIDAMHDDSAYQHFGVTLTAHYAKCGAIRFQNLDYPDDDPDDDELRAQLWKIGVQGLELWKLRLLDDGSSGQAPSK